MADIDKPAIKEPVVRNIDFKFRVDISEREQIRQLARHLQRKEADAVRHVILTAVQALENITNASTNEVQHAQKN